MPLETWSRCAVAQRSAALGYRSELGKRSILRDDTAERSLTLVAAQLDSGRHFAKRRCMLPSIGSRSGLNTAA
jgi:hypothetical protein